MNMAGEVGHIVYAARMLTHLEGRVHDPLYWVGTVFPDIRHLGVVSRRRTHAGDTNLQSLVGHNDFHTGMRIHAWIDATREKFLRDQHMKEHLPWHPFVPFCLNLLEDELLYPYFDDWNLIHRLLNKTYADELIYCSSTSSLQTWHTLLQHYFKNAPTDDSRAELAEAIGLSPEVARESNNIVRLLKSDGRATKMLESFWQHLETILR
jgi:hypothetical protein